MRPQGRRLRPVRVLRGAPIVASGGRNGRVYGVYDADELDVSVTDVPGSVLSTGALPPGASPMQHPFLSAQAHSAQHESALHEALSGAESTAAFLVALEAQDLQVRAAPVQVD